MKKLYISLITTLFVIMTSVSALETSDGSNAASPPQKERPSLVQIGGNYTHVNIKPGTTAGFHGNMGGVQGMYEYRPLNSIYAAVKGMWREGRTTGHSAKRSLFDINVHERVGYTLATKRKQYLLTLFTGAGYRYLAHKLHHKGSVMKLHYNEFYIPVGALQDFKINTTLAVGVYFTWMPQVNSTVNLIPLNAAQWILKKRLANFLVELPMNFCMGSMRQFLISFKPFYEYWQDGRSTAKTTTGISLGVPGNTYNFWGAELNFGYKF